MPNELPLNRQCVVIGDELATSWHLIGKALAHGTKVDWANEGSHWRANEKAFIGPIK